MEYINLYARVGNLSDVLSPARYLEHLPSLADDLPAGARGFATAPEHQHDEDLVIRYTGVSSFNAGSAEDDDRANLGTGILDEVLPHQNGCSREIAFWNGSLAVVCRDLVATWTEADCPSNPSARHVLPSRSQLPRWG